MEKIKYIGKVLPDGHLSLPANIIKQLKLKTNSKLKVQIEPEKKAEQNLSRFCGQWEGDDVEDIVNDVYKYRNKNIRSDHITL